VLVEEHGQLVAVVALYRAFTPALARDPLADRERLERRFLSLRHEIVVAVPARARVGLPEVREQE